MVRDIYGEEIKVGSLIVLKNTEALPFLIADISEPISKPTQMGMLPVRKLKVACVIDVELVGEVGQINGMVLKHEQAPAGQGSSLLKI